MCEETVRSAPDRSCPPCPPPLRRFPPTRLRRRPPPPFRPGGAAAAPAETAAAHGRGRTLWIAGALTLLVVGGAVGWDTVKYDFVAKRFGEVEPGGLYRAGQISDTMFVPTVRENGIQTVICLTSDDKTNPDHQAEVAALNAMPDVRFERYPLLGDGTGNIDVYTDALCSLALNRRAGRTVLVHCAAGAQRTGSIIAAYRLLVLRDDPAAVYADLSRYGWEPADRPMLEYLNAHLPEVAAELYERSLIAEVPDPVPFLGP